MVGKGLFEKDGYIRKLGEGRVWRRLRVVDEAST
jgi:hypothetical protein